MSWRLRMLADRAASRVARDLAAERTSGRLILWLPVLFAAGMLVYFSAEQEPSLLAALALVGFTAGIAVVARRRFLAFSLACAACAVAAGFATATLRTAWIDHPVLIPPTGVVRLTGYVAHLERRSTSDRILLAVTQAQGRGLAAPLHLVRLSVLKGSAPEAGTPIAISARLLPPLGPPAPGAHDFGRALWFAGIDAIGFGLGRPTPVAIGGAAPLAVRVHQDLARLREAMARRIRQALAEPAASIAVALVAGDRSGIAPQVEESMRRSGLTHVLSISGLHMAMVAGTLFALARGVLAAIPALALRWPLKSIAAGVALAGSAFYLLLSGNDEPAQRSFFMSALVLLGVLAGRPALSLRSVAIAGVVVLGAAPVAVLDPGTQMSFAATLALIAAYERVRALQPGAPPRGVVKLLGHKAGMAILGVVATSIVAGLATAPFGALHFQRLAPLGVLSNLAAMPAISLLVMPFGLAGALLLPFGLDGLAWPVMGFGVDIMVAVSDAVAGLPGAMIRVDGMSGACAASVALSLCCLCLLRGSLMALAVPPAVLAVMLSGAPPRPDILIAPDARTVAMRDAAGTLSVAGARANRLAVAQWLALAGDDRAADTSDLRGRFTCDRLGCAAPLPQGGMLALSLSPRSLETDCLEARLLVTPFAAPAQCPAEVFDPARLRRTGAVALFDVAGTWRVVPARDPNVQRPWMPILPEAPAPAVPVPDLERAAVE